MLAVFLCLSVGVGQAAQHPFSYDAVFLEGCSCKDICVTEITGSDAGCHGLAAMDFRKASYDGASFSGTRAAWAWGPGWVRLYVDADGAKRDVLTTFLTAALADWGKLEAVTPSKISVMGQGTYKATIADGQTASITVVPVFGADGKTPVEHTNLVSLFHDRLSQGKIQEAWYKGAEHDFTWKDTNAFFNPHCRMKGKV